MQVLLRKIMFHGHLRRNHAMSKRISVFLVALKRFDTEILHLLPIPNRVTSTVYYTVHNVHSLPEICMHYLPLRDRYTKEIDFPVQAYICARTVDTQ